MRYKIGDKVVIRTWEDLKEEYNKSDEEGNIYIVNQDLYFMDSMEDKINKNFPDRVLTIVTMVDIEDKQYYKMYNMKEYIWVNEMIKCKEFEPITNKEFIKSRFEILDIR